MPDLVDVLLIASRVLNGFRVALNPVVPPFNRLESAILSKLSIHVSSQFSTQFEDHVASINFVQRDGGHRRVRMYKWVLPGRYDWRRGVLFQPEEGPMKQASFKIRLPDGSSFGGSLVSIDGVICNMTFGQDVSLIKDLSNVEIEITGGPICGVRGLRN